MGHLRKSSEISRHDESENTAFTCKAKNPITSHAETIAAVDLFCGVGGMTHGFVRAGIPVMAGVDNDRTCRFAYEANNNGARFVEKSVTGLTVEEVVSWYPEKCIRVLVGCAPCQPFSNYANRYAKDHRWGLLYAFRDLVNDIGPEIVSMENVPELARRGHGVYLDFVKGLKKSGYFVESTIVNCADYGVPQRRERLVLLASRLGPIKIIPPTHSEDQHITVREVIGELPPILAGGKPPKSDPLHISSRLSSVNMSRIKATPEGGGWKDWPEKLRLACHQRKTGTEYVSVYGRMNWDDLAPTVTTQCYGLGNGRFGHPQQNRAISLREASILQTFPRSYKFADSVEAITFRHIGKHIGNAVPVRLGEAIALSIREHVAQFHQGGSAKHRPLTNVSKLEITSSK